MPAVKYGQCSNGTRFEDLDPNGFADCPVTLQSIGHCYIFILIYFLLCSRSCVHWVTTVHTLIFQTAPATTFAKKTSLIIT